MKEFIEKFSEKFLRKSRKLTDIFFVAIILSIIVTYAGALIGYGITSYPLIKDLFTSLVYSEGMLQFLSDYAMFIGIWVVVLFTVSLFKGNHPMFKAISYNKKGNNIKGFLVGTILGYATNGFAILMSVLMGDIKLSFYGFDFVVLLAFAISVFIQSGAEELVDRFYLYQKLRRRYMFPWIAILLNSLVFAYLHVGNPGFTLIAGVQIFLVGLIFSLMVYYYNNLWGAMAFHAAWNFSQSIVYGLPNSGIVSEYSIFTLEAASARNGFFYNVNFGVEGSIGAVLILRVLAVAIILMNRGKSECNNVWAEVENAPRTSAGTTIRRLSDDTEKNQDNQ